MKKFYVMALTCLVASAAFAFDFEPSTNPWFGVTVGYVSSQLNTTYTYGSKVSTTTTGILGEAKKTDYEKQIEQQAKESYDKFSNTTPYRNYSTGLQVGLTFNPEFKYGLGLKTGLLYECAINQGSVTASSSESDKSYSYSYSYSDKSSYISSDHALSIPLQVSWRVEVYKELSLFIYTGIVLDIHLGTYGESTTTSSLSGTYAGETESQSSQTKEYVKGGYFRGPSEYYYQYPYNNYDNNMYSSKASYKRDETIDGKTTKGEWEEETIDEPMATRCNVLWAVGAGIQWKGLRLTVGGQFGMNNMVINETYKEYATAKVNKPFEISLSYMFLDKKK